VLAGVLEEEKRDSFVFQPVPFYYIEIAHVLLNQATDEFGADWYKVCSASFLAAHSYSHCCCSNGTELHRRNAFYLLPQNDIKKL
jgi:hypothetical protein